MISENDFAKITNEVITRLEGGYYHPQMLKDGRIKDQRYANSGETMFGIDRVAGGTINDSLAGKQFWAKIDNANASKNWAWNYKGGALNTELKDLASRVMYPVYVRHSQKYLSPKAQEIVNSDPRLVFNFSYASWNGAGWFKKFAEKINEAVAKGVTNTDELVKIALDARINSGSSLVAQGGNKISKFINTLGGAVSSANEQVIETIKKKPYIIVGMIAILTVSAYVLYKTLKTK